MSASFRHLLKLRALACWVLVAWALLPGGAVAAREALRPVRYDLRTLAHPVDLHQRRVAYQQLHAVVALQGIVNRERPRLMISYGADERRPDLERWWYEQAQGLRHDAGQLGAPVVLTPAEKSAAELIAAHHAELAGLVVWNPAVPATALIASTLAGQENLIPVTPASFEGSLLPELERRGLRVALDLTAITPPAATGSVKCDWYLWLLDRAAHNPRANPRYLAYYVDGFAMDDVDGHWGSIGLVNHDFVIAHGGFFVDLSMWDDEKPCDDPAQPLGTDARTLGQVLDTLRARSGGDLIRAYGFIPWGYKYADARQRGKHGVVDGEWRFINLFSRRNAVVAESDAAAMVDFANGSFWRHFTTTAPALLNDVLNTTATATAPAAVAAPPALAAPPGIKSICWLMGDYDSSAWMAQMLPDRWGDPARGRVPLSWMMNPLCFERAPHIQRLLQEQRTPHDSFVAYEGLGYIDPNLSPDLATLTRESKQAFARYGLTISGCLITPPSEDIGFWLKPEVIDAYRRFSPDGLGLHPGGLFMPRQEVVGGTPLSWMAYFTNFNEVDAVAVAQRIQRESRPADDLLLIRAIQVAPGFIERVMNELNREAPRYQAVDAHTFFARLKARPAQGEAAP